MRITVQKLELATKVLLQAQYGLAVLTILSALPGVLSSFGLDGAGVLQASAMSLAILVLVRERVSGWIIGLAMKQVREGRQRP